jgi:hypothetical protein
LLKGTIISNNAVAANNVFAVQIIPSQCDQNGWLAYGYGTTPVLAITNLTPGIISTVQSESFRVVSAQFTLTPQGSLLNQAGSGITGYNPDNNGFVFTPTNVANLNIARPFKSVDTQIWHWMPTDNAGSDETQFYAAGGPLISSSAIYCYLNIPIASDQLTTFQIDYQLAIEYVPSVGFRPWVEKDTPQQDVRAQMYAARYAEHHFDPIMIGKLCDYQNYLADALAREDGRTGWEGMTSYGTEGVGGAHITDKDDHPTAMSDTWWNHIRNMEFVEARKHIDQFGADFARGTLKYGAEVLNDFIPGQMFDINTDLLGAASAA